jgi:hypothetical protein
MNSTIEKYDVAVIGGGPAGMIAAGRAAELGASVVLLEKNKTLGKKLLVTGGGRCNITNAETDVREFIKHFGASGKYLISLFYKFGVAETLEFFRKLGVKTKNEKDGRVFPTTDSADSVLQALLKYLEKNSVKIITEATITEFEVSSAGTIKIKLATKDVWAKKVILATGGVACPTTGSNGELFEKIKELGHTIVETKPALVPLKIKEKLCRRLSGVSFSDIELSCGKIKKRGDLLFAHFGISGPTVLNLSGHLGSEETINLDLFPQKNNEELEKDLMELIAESPNKNLGHVFTKMIPERVVDVLFYNLQLDTKKKAHSFSKDERKKFVNVLKNLTLHVTGNLGYPQAMYSRGGVDLNEINLRKMQSKLVPEIFFVGDILDIERECGGFSLQMCWTTGFIAGEAVVEARE